MDKTRPHSISLIDENHGLYGNFIGLQYIFERPLKAGVLARSVTELVNQFPALSSQYNSKSGETVNANVTVSLQLRQSPKTFADIMASSERPQYVEDADRLAALSGHAPLSTFTLTEFSDGSMILGIAISHMLTDAAGYHLLVKHLSVIYNAIASDIALPRFPFPTHLDVFEFGTARSKAESLHTLKQRGLPKPIPVKGLLGKFIKSLIIKAMDKSVNENPPIKLHLTADDIARLKDTVLTESGEEWISTNIALCAHFTSIMAKLSYGGDIKTEMQIGQLLDLRGRFFEGDADKQTNFVGNAILIHIDKATFPDSLQNTSRGDLAQYFKQRQAQTTAQDIKTRLDLLADCLRHGYTNPELDVKNPIISLNNQSKMPVYDVTFGGQHPARIIPQDVGDNIMFFPAADGGIEIHIRDIVNPQRQQELLTSGWQSQIYNF